MAVTMKEQQTTIIGGVRFDNIRVVSKSKDNLGVWNVTTEEGTTFAFTEQDLNKKAAVYSKSVNSNSPITTRVQNFEGGVFGNPKREDIIDVVNSNNVIVVTKDDKKRHDSVMSDSPSTLVISDSSDTFVGRFLDTHY